MQNDDPAKEPLANNNFSNWLKNLSKNPWRLGTIIAALVVVLGVILWFVFRANSPEPQGSPGNQVSEASSAALQAGRELSNNKCSGEGPVALTALPMAADDFAFIIPYGLVVGSHVTPIDHQYFSPADPNSTPDSYPVYAMADGRLTEISHRTRSVSEPGKPSNDYRFVFAHTCTFLTYFDLVTSLAPDIQAEFDKNKRSNGQEFAALDIEVKAGQLVGYIGGQTLDFAVWDTQKPLGGFISPELYTAEPWKVYTADPLDYYANDIKQVITAKYLRSGQGSSGKIDWDQAGRLVGNWFLEGSNGYEGDRQNPDGLYWRGHVSFAPDHLDPTTYIASFGTFAQSGDGLQFMIDSAASSPAEATTESGIVKYQLQKHSYLTTDGVPWDRTTHTLNPKLVASNSPTAGCVLVQLTEPQRLKLQTFPGALCNETSEFTAQAADYIR